MIFLIILGSLLGIILLLLLLPVTIKLEYYDSMLIEMRYAGFRLFRLDASEQEEEVKQIVEETSDLTDEKKAGSSFDIAGLLKEQGITGFLKMILELGKIAVNTSKGIIRRIGIKSFHINLIIATGDAADTANLYGQACAVVFPVYSLIFSYVKCKDKSVNIKPDFDGEENRISFETYASLRPIHVLIGGIRAVVDLWPILKIVKSAIKRTPRAKSKNSEDSSVNAEPQEAAGQDKKAV